MAKPFRVFQVGELLKFGQIDIYAGSQPPLFCKGWFMRLVWLWMIVEILASTILTIQVSTILVIIGPVPIILGNSTDDEVAVHPKWRCKSKGYPASACEPASASPHQRWECRGPAWLKGDSLGVALSPLHCQNLFLFAKLRNQFFRAYLLASPPKLWHGAHTKDAG